MEKWLKRRKKMTRGLAVGIGFALLVVSASGCSTVKVKPTDERVILIVKKYNEPPKALITPEGAVIGVEKLRHGDTIRLINRYGGTVKILIQPGLVEGDHEFSLDHRGQRVITVKITDPDMTVFQINFEDDDGDHGGADMGVEPPGGG